MLVILILQRVNVKSLTNFFQKYFMCPLI